MQFQMAVAALLFTSLFAIPAQAIEEEECKKKRTVKTEKGRESVSSSQQRVANSPIQPILKDSSKTSQDVEFEGVPANYYKNLDLNSF